MPGNPVVLPPERILEELVRLFLAPAHDRHVYTVYGPYAKLHPFQRRLQDAVTNGNFNSFGRVEYLSLNREICSHLESKGLSAKVSSLAASRRDDELRSVLSGAFRELVTSRLEEQGTIALVLADFELLYAYGLGGNDISIVRQIAINGKRVCLMVPGNLRDGRLWVFDEDDESRREFPEPLLFINSGWVFTLAGDKP
jgi:hypothetical protein